MASPFLGLPIGIGSKTDFAKLPSLFGSSASFAVFWDMTRPNEFQIDRRNESYRDASAYSVVVIGHPLSRDQKEVLCYDLYWSVTRSISEGYLVFPASTVKCSMCAVLADEAVWITPPR
jgi:hypothetical protein